MISHESQPQYPPAEPAIEVIGQPPAGIPFAAPALRGLRLWIAEKRLEKTLASAENLEVSVEAHKEMADVYGNMVIDEKSPSRVKHRDPDPKMLPETLSQRSQDRRAAKRQSEVFDIRSGELYRLRRVYGDNIGSDEFEAIIKAERGISNSDRRKALKANEEYKELEHKANEIEHKVRTSARGEDIPGRVVRWRLDRAVEKAPKKRMRAAGIALQTAVNRGIVKPEIVTRAAVSSADEDSYDYEDASIPEQGEEELLTNVVAVGGTPQHEIISPKMESTLTTEQAAVEAEKLYLSTKQKLLEKVKEERLKSPNEALPAWRVKEIWSDEPEYRETLLEEYPSEDRTIIENVIANLVADDAKAREAGKPELWSIRKREAEEKPASQEREQHQQNRRGKRVDLDTKEDYTSSGRWSGGSLERISQTIANANSQEAKEIRESRNVPVVPPEEFAQISQDNKMKAIDDFLGTDASPEDVQDLSRELWKHYKRTNPDRP